MAEIVRLHKRRQTWHTSNHNANIHLPNASDDDGDVAPRYVYLVMNLQAVMQNENTQDARTTDPIST